MKKYILILFLSILGFAPNANAIWYSSSWTYCQKITINSSQVSTTTTAFPVLATSTQDVLKTATNGGHTQKDDGSDIIFTNGTDCNSDGGSLLDFERELYASTTGQIVFWIETPVSSTTDETVLMYYGNSSATDQATTTGVWDADLDGDGDRDYKLVAHMAEDPSISTDGYCGGSTYEACDSSTNQNHFDSSGTMTTSDLVIGEIGNAIDFDGSNDYLSNALTWNGGGATVSYWEYQASADVKTSSLFGFGNGSVSNRFQSHSPWTSSVLFWDYGNPASARTSTSFSSYVDKWTNVCLLASGGVGTNFQGIFLDGVLKVSNNIGFTNSNLNTFTLGYNSEASLVSFTPWHKGKIDEFRIADYKRSNGWCITEYKTSSSVGTFLNIGSEETPAITVEEEYIIIFE